MGIGVSHAATGGVRRNSRPVELSKLNKPKLDISGLVLRECLLHASDPFLDLVDRGVLELGDVGGTHCDGIDGGGIMKAAFDPWQVRVGQGEGGEESSAYHSSRPLERHMHRAGLPLVGSSTGRGPGRRLLIGCCSCLARTAPRVKFR